MRKTLRVLGAVLVAAGLLALAWTVVVWRWQDPFTALYTHWQQERLSRTVEREFAAYRPLAAGAGLVAERRTIADEAARFRADAGDDRPIGRIAIPRLGLDLVLLNGADSAALRRGPGRDLRSFMPGQNRLVYVAGHRTTYLAPFSHIERIRPGDPIRLELPYGTFTYRAYAHRVVAASDLSVLRSPRHELLVLQACHPRFFATHRYLVYARLVSVDPRGSAPYALAAG